jgi:hypothetical protein
MNPALGFSVASIPVTKRASARVAFIGVKESARMTLGDCFKQFGIDTVVVKDNAPERLSKEKFDACVLALEADAEAVMHAARTSASNSRMVIYGLGGTAREAMRYSKYGINAVFQEPLERPSALKLVRATQPLLLHEFRRYVRIPVITEVALTMGDGRRFMASSQEISSGGMSMKSTDEISAGSSAEISLALLTLPRIWVRGTTTWQNPRTKAFGFRFDPKDDRRLRIKEWIEAYLEN